MVNAAQWAREVDRHRPHPTSDTSFARLRAELAQHNPAAGVVERITGALSL